MDSLWRLPRLSSRQEFTVRDTRTLHVTQKTPIGAQERSVGLRWRSERPSVACSPPAVSATSTVDGHHKRRYQSHKPFQSRYQMRLSDRKASDIRPQCMERTNVASLRSIHAMQGSNRELSLCNRPRIRAIQCVNIWFTAATPRHSRE